MHKDDGDNKRLLEEYKNKFILRQRSVEYPAFSKNIKLSFYANNTGYDKSTCESNDDIVEKGIYQFQTIKVNGEYYNIFFDNGCSDFVSKKSAVDKIGDQAVLEYDGPITLGGVGGIVTESPYGIYTVNLPVRNNKTAKMTGVCLQNITTKFPKYPIAGRVQNDIHNAYKSQGGDPSRLPKLPQFVGGDIDFMIGVKYLRYHPREVFRLPSGLTIYESMFENADGGFGVIGGPHQVFTEIDRHFRVHFFIPGI